ncbi:MAG TPA: endonuclease/exonuclease/phosphatase family protein [Acidimicrobiales bacterium]|nr:endonuclease/exonuclease/phosphatase family protein [Acidimicrobiales bacterium]
MLRVVTLNIWNLSADWRARRGAIVAVLREAEADVVCLQEVVETEQGNQAEWLAAELGGWSVAYAGATVGEGFRAGNAVLSRRPVDATAGVELPYVADDLEVQRVVVHARTGGVDVFSTHLAWQLHDAALRERQVQELMRFVSARADPEAALGPVVAGDFNAEPDSTVVRYLCGLATLDGASTYLQDAWRLAGDGGPGLTWSNRNPHAALDQEPDRRIDYVFSGFHGRSGAGRPVECQVVADAPVDGVWPTDHFGVLAVLASPVTD